MTQCQKKADSDLPGTFWEKKGHAVSPPFILQMTGFSKPVQANVNWRLGMVTVIAASRTPQASVVTLAQGLVHLA